jgi:hypothetical protein
VSAIRLPRVPAVSAAVFALLLGVLLLAAPAMAGTGGVSEPGEAAPVGPPRKATLKPNGKAIAPANAPKRVKRAIKFANRIRRKPYKWGGGHSGWKVDRAYDCSGAVSFALRGARMLKSPIPSSALTRWAKKGKGKWITVYAHGGHTFAMIAGLRWDTSGNERGSGPRWHKTGRSTRGYKVRHFRGF